MLQLANILAWTARRVATPTELVLSARIRQPAGTFGPMKMTKASIGRSPYAVVCMKSLKWYSLFIHGTKLNIDLANYGNSTPGTPVELWSKWNGLFVMILR